RGLTGLAAVQRKPTGFGSPSIVWQSLVADDDESRSAIAAAMVARGGDRMAFQFGFPGTSGLDAIRREAEAAGYRTTLVPYLRSPFILLAGRCSEYLAGRCRAEMKELQRRRRQLEREGDLTFETYNGSDRLDQLLAEAFAVEGSKRKRDGGTAIASRPESLRYYTSLARWAAAEGVLRLSFVRLSGRAIAFSFMMEDERSLYGIKSGYSDQYRRFRPGFLALLDAIQAAFQDGRRTLELLGNDEPWKRGWCHGVRERVTLLAFAPHIHANV
ncbi:MAG: GNAT family N-acetyltransferase, partial [Vicinamibacterales bacterium]